MNKKVSFVAKPQAAHDPDEWVNGGTPTDIAAIAALAPPSPQAIERSSTKRLTFDVSVDLHTRIKVQCAKKGVKLADEIRLLLEKHFPHTEERGEL